MLLPVLPKRRSNSLSTPITEAASMSKAVVAEGTVERCGIHDGNSEAAWSKPGWRLRTVKASAQLSVEPWVVAWLVPFLVVGVAG